MAACTSKSIFDLAENYFVKKRNNSNLLISKIKWKWSLISTKQKFIIHYTSSKFKKISSVQKIVTQYNTQNPSFEFFC